MKRKIIIFVLMIFTLQYTFSDIDMERYEAERLNIIESSPSIEDAFNYLAMSKSIGFGYHDIYLEVILKDEN